jgi:hypothetical protein
LSNFLSSLQLRSLCRIVLLWKCSQLRPSFRLNLSLYAIVSAPNIHGSGSFVESHRLNVRVGGMKCVVKFLSHAAFVVLTFKQQITPVLEGVPWLLPASLVWSFWKST